MDVGAIRLFFVVCLGTGATNAFIEFAFGNSALKDLSGFLSEISSLSLEKSTQIAQNCTIDDWH
jgi:hypothetical protein